MQEARALIDRTVAASSTTPSARIMHSVADRDPLDLNPVRVQSLYKG